MKEVKLFSKQKKIPFQKCQKWKKKMKIKTDKNPHGMVWYRIVDHAKSCELIVWCPHTISLRAKACSGLWCFDWFWSFILNMCCSNRSQIWRSSCDRKSRFFWEAACYIEEYKYRYSIKEIKIFFFTKRDRVKKRNTLLTLLWKC